MRRIYVTSFLDYLIYTSKYNTFPLKRLIHQDTPSITLKSSTAGCKNNHVISKCSEIAQLVVLSDHLFNCFSILHTLPFIIIPFLYRRHCVVGADRKSLILPYHTLIVEFMLYTFEYHPYMYNYNRNHSEGCSLQCEIRRIS